MDMMLSLFTLCTTNRLQIYTHPILFYFNKRLRPTDTCPYTPDGDQYGECDNDGMKYDQDMTTGSRIQGMIEDNRQNNTVYSSQNGSCNSTKSCETMLVYNGQNGCCSQYESRAYK